MVVGNSPEWLPSGFVEKVKYKNGRKIKYYLDEARGKKYHSKKEVMCATEDNHKLVTPQKENGDVNGLSDNKIDEVSIKTNDSVAWLPSGWMIEERTRHSGSSKGSVYKVYTDLSSGSKFYSKAAVNRYLSTLDHANTINLQNKIDNVDNKPNVVEPAVDMSVQLVPVTNTGGINNVNDKPKVDEPTHKKRRKGNPFVMVATVQTTDEDLPRGWIKEIRTSKSGNKTRTDPYYTDPVSGYTFRSKLDALRYLKTNDIGSCICKPLRREPGDVKLIENEIPYSNPAKEKLPVHKRQRLRGEVNGEGGSGTKVLAESDAGISKRKQRHNRLDSVKVPSVGTDSLEEKISCENSEKNAEIINNLKPENDVSKEGPHSSISKKRKGLTLPSRISKRLAGSQPEVASNLDLNERSLRAAARKSFVDDEVDKSSNTSAGVAGNQPEMDLNEPEMDLNEHSLADAARGSYASEVDRSPKASASVPLPSEIEPPKASAEQQPLIADVVKYLFGEVEKPPVEDSTVPKEQPLGTASENQIDDGKSLQESQLCYDFGDSWSDPLEFALKTLRGEISIDDPLAFPSCFNEQVNIPFNPDTPNQNEPAAPTESLKQQNTVDQLPASSSSFSTVENIGFASFGGYNCQSNTEIGKEDFHAKFNP